MRNAWLSLLAAAALMPAALPAQEWSPAQKEVWDVEVACWSTRTMASVESCFHDSFVGWGINSTVPTTKADRRSIFARSFETEDVVFQFLKPIEITVRGDMAVLIYIANYTTKNRTTGAETTVTERWTDIMVRDGGRWSWIADHGQDITNQ